MTINSLKDRCPLCNDAPEMHAFILNLFLTHKRIMQYSEKIFAAHGFTTLEFDTLATLLRVADNGLMKPSEIYKNLIVSSGGITKVLKKFEELKLIIRIPDPDDKRSHWVEITPKGEAIGLEILKEIIQAHKNNLKATAKELQSMGDKLEKIVEQLN
ncbi:MarR family winged helix-turn-helix transcriptional regulator [Thiomicrorhabdus arctica]|jgi:DNA-binding MarR family transcriptional regulator|uniref:MarR family winged helix-turn-helix transcriptional regulator n=1 Tax=Thiomicrorhabdus arctica TaxID=131540 RepID=UPI0003751E66|nr:MarR family transcriptional regulator [Thiomicrorhabdus arctica]